MNTVELFHAGDLAQALESAKTELRQNPDDLSARYRFCELLCFAGEWERVSKHLELVFDQDVSLGGVTILFRQLVKAAEARQSWYLDGVSPEFVQGDNPSEEVRHRLDVAASLRSGDSQSAARLLESANAVTTTMAGSCNDQPMEHWRDLDDVTAGCLEVLTSEGRYFWIPWSDIISLEFDKPERPLDLLWRSIKSITGNVPEGRLYMPAIYLGSADAEDDLLKLGRRTDWVGQEGMPIRGVGRREFFLGGDMTIDSLKIDRLSFQSSS